MLFTENSTPWNPTVSKHHQTTFLAHFHTKGYENEKNIHNIHSLKQFSPTNRFSSWDGIRVVTISDFQYTIIMSKRFYNNI